MAAATVASPVTLENHQLARPTAPGNAESVSQPLPDHVPHIEAFVERLNQEIPHMLAKPQTYDNVLACFITWEDNDNSQITESAGELRRLLEDEYGYMTEEVKLESSDDELGSDPLRQFNREVSAHVDSISRKTVPSGKKLGNNLFILYYGGHGDYESSSRKGSWFNRQIKEPSRLEWDSIEPIITLATCDILFLFDCCHATSIVPREIKCRRRCEILGASGNVEETSARSNNFTAALTSILKEYTTDPKTASHLSWRLSDRNVCNKFGLEATPQHSRLTKDRTLKSSIIVAPQPAIQPPVDNHQSASKEPNGSPVTAPLGKAEFKKAVIEAEQASDAYVLMAVRFSDPSDRPFLGEWQEWISQRPQNIDDVVFETPENLIKELLQEMVRKKVKFHCAFPGDSALGIISVPIWLWSCLGPGPAWTYIDLIRSNQDLLHPIAHSSTLEVVSTATKGVQTAGPAPQSVLTRSPPLTPPKSLFGGMAATPRRGLFSSVLRSLRSMSGLPAFGAESLALPAAEVLALPAELAPRKVKAKGHMRSGPLYEKPRYQSIGNPLARQDSWFWARPEQQENPRIEKKLRKRRIKDPKLTNAVEYHKLGLWVKLD